MDNTKKITIIVATLIPLILAGCWDKVEINERAFVTAIGIDVTSEGETAQGEKDEKSKEGGDKYTVTYAFPNIAAIGKQGQGEPMFVVSSKGSTPYETTRQVRTRLHQSMFFSHMKVVVIGEDVARNADMLKEILDALERHYAVSRRINVLVAKGKAEDVLNVDAQYESDIGIYLSSIFEASTQTARFNPLTLGDLLENLHDEDNVLMPRVTPGEKDVKVGGSGVIKNFQLVGWLGEAENRDIMFLQDRIESDVVVVAPFENEIIIPYEITQSDTKKTVSKEGDKLKATFKIEMEGDIRQYVMDSPEEVLDDKFLKKVETTVENFLKGKIEKTVEKLQKEFKLDVIGINEYLVKFKPSIWKEVKADWDATFPEIEIEIQVDVKIRRVGLTK